MDTLFRPTSRCLLDLPLGKTHPSSLNDTPQASADRQPTRTSPSALNHSRMPDNSTLQSRKRPFSAFANDKTPAPSNSSWPTVGQTPLDLEVHIAQIGADARKLLRRQNQGAVPFAVLAPLLLSCIDVAKKYSQEVANGMPDIPGQQRNNSNNNHMQNQVFQQPGQGQNSVNLLDEESDRDEVPNHAAAAAAAAVSQQQMNMSTFQQFADETVAFTDLSPALMQPTGSTNALLQHQQTQMPIDPNWFEIVVQPHWTTPTNDLTGRPDASIPSKPRLVSLDKLHKIESHLTNLLISAKPNKNVPSDSRLVRLRQFKSGSFSIRTASHQGIDHLIDTIKTWTVLFGTSAAIHIPTYSVKIYSIKRGSFCDANGTIMSEHSILNALISTGQSTNSGAATAYLLPGSVSAVRWNDLTPTSSQHACIIIDFRVPESANAAVRLGLTWSGTLHKPTFLRREMDFIQCDRCLAYGTHLSYRCDAETVVCELCSGPHSKSECPSTGVFKPHAQRFREKRCVACGDNHSARFEKCRVRLAEHERARNVRKDLKSRPFGGHPGRERPRFLSVASPALYL